MADEYTKADIDAAVATAVEKATSALTEKIEAAEAKNAGLLDDLKKAQRELRAAKDITPETHQAEVERADKAESALADAAKSLKAAQAERDKATKALETEQAASRAYAINAEIAGAIAEGNVTPGLVPAFKALVAQQAKADLVDGKLAVMIGDKSAAEHIKAYLASDDGKHFVSAMSNGGGGAPGGAGGGAPPKVMPRPQFEALPPGQKMAFVREGGALTDAA